MTAHAHHEPTSQRVAQPATEKTMRNLLKSYLPIGTIAGCAVTLVGVVWWVANQSRDIQDNRKAAGLADQKAESALAAATELRLKEAEILAKLSGIETQLAELRALILRRSP